MRPWSTLWCQHSTFHDPPSSAQVRVKPINLWRKPASRGLPRKVENPAMCPVVPTTTKLHSRGIHWKNSHSPWPTLLVAW